MKDLSSEIMIHNKSGDLEYLQFRRLLEYEDTLVHAFTTRLGGVSEGINYSLNFSQDSDSKESILKNYKIICDELNIDVNDIVCTLQKHTDNIESVKKDNCGAGIFKNHICDSYDGLITNQKNVILRTVCADCSLVVLFDPIKNVISNVHAGWKGIVIEIIPNAIQKMIKEYNCNPLDIIVCAGPSIKKCCFEFSKSDLFHFDKYLQIEGVVIEHEDKDKCYIDINIIIEYQLKQNGIRDENIEISNICTMCNNDTFFSYRGDNGKTGRQIMLVGLK